MEATRALSKLERHRVVRRLLLDCQPLPPERWDRQFAAWRAGGDRQLEVDR